MSAHTAPATRATGVSVDRPRRERRAKGMTVAELRELPASIDMETLFRALALGRSKGYELLRKDEMPVEILRFGRAYRARTADVLALLGVDQATTGTGGAA